MTKKTQESEDDRLEIRQTQMQATLRTASDFFGGMADLAGAFGKKGAKIAKASAIAQATIKTYEAATGAYSAVAGIPVVGPALAPVAAAAAIAAGFANIAAIKSQPIGNYAHGGVVPGSSFSGDNVSANVNSGEMILNRSQQANLFNQANGRGGGSGKITIINQTSTPIGEVEESQGANGERQLIIREAVDIAKQELTDEVSLGYGDFEERTRGAFSLSRG
jgi:hypothetical protein